jgi:hypothetical protein
MSNAFKRLQALLPKPLLMLGDVVAVVDGIAEIELPGGGRMQARGAADVGDRVWFRDGVIEGPAPDLPIVFVEI